MKKILVIILFLGLLCEVTSAEIDRVYLVPFSHLDVGYTAPVDTIEELQNSYIDSAIKYCEQTQDWPQESRFKWTSECWWPIENYIRDRSPEQIGNLLELINDGRIEAGAFYVNLLTELSGPEELIRSVKPPLGIKPKTGMIDDVPGYTWLIPEILQGIGVEYLSVAPNGFLSQFYSTTNLPDPFFWEGKDGSKILVWYSLDSTCAYLEGAILGFFSNYETVAYKLPRLLSRLESEGYPYSAIHICCVSGDNGPPSLKPCEIAKRWNEEHESPKIIVSTNSEFFDYMMENYENEINTYSGDCPDWWAFIISSCAREGIENKLLIDIIPKVELLSSLAGISNQDFNYPQDIWELYRGSLLFSEHTFGAVDLEHSPDMWARKVSWLQASLERSDTLIKEAMASISQKISSSRHEVAVFNTLPFKRNDIACIGLDILGLSGSSFTVIDEETQDTIPSQVEGDTLFFVASSVPSLGYKTYRIEESAKSAESKGILENSFYRVEIDPKTGGISSIYDKDKERELVSEGGHFAEYIYNGNQGPTSVEITPGKNGPVLRSRIANMSAPGSRSVRSEFILYDSLKKIDIQIAVDKEEPTSELETVHFSFPFVLNGDVYYDIPSGMVNLYDDELSGFRALHYAIQHWVAIFSSGLSCVWTSNAPLVRFLSDSPNFDCLVHISNEGSLYRASTGMLCFCFGLTSGDSVSQNKFGYSFANPLVVEPLEEKKDGLPEGEYSFIAIHPDCIRLLTLKRADDENGYIIRLKNPNVSSTEVNIETGFGLNSAYITDLLEENIENLSVDSNRVSFSIPSFAIKTIRFIPTPPGIEEQIEKASWLIVFPNPALREVLFKSRLSGSLTVDIFDLEGRLIRSLSGKEPRWLLYDNQGRRVPSGVYFYMAKLGLRKKMGKLVIVGGR